MQPIAIAAQPGTRRLDYFAISPQPGTDVHEIWWQAAIPSGPPMEWQALGGAGTAVAATWLGDGSGLVVITDGNDSRLWSNVLDPATNTWGGWHSNPDGSLHDLVIASS